METFLHFLHVLSACVLVGSTVFVGLVLIPTLRKALGDAERMAFLRSMAFRARIATWTSIILLLSTGFYRISGIGDFLWRTGYGKLLIWKIILVLLAAFLAFLHDFVIGAKVARMDPADPLFKKLRTLTIIFAQIQLLALLGIVYLSVTMRLFGW